MQIINLIGEIFNVIFLGPIVNLLVLILKLLESVHIPGALGFAIIILSVLVRLLVWPFMSSQLKASRKMAELKPHLDELKKKHGNDKQAFASAQMELYKQHGVSPAGGCLPALIQMPVLLALYRAIFAFFSGQQGLNQVNAILYNSAWHLKSVPDLSFFGLNLATKPSEFLSAGYLLLLIPVVTAGLQFIQTKMMSPKPVKGYPGDSKKEEKEKESTDESMAAMQQQMMYMMPLMIGYFAFQFPIGLAIYWNTVTIFSIIQQKILFK